MKQVKIQVTYPGYYKKFICLGGKCPATCCAGWNISIDADTRKIYKKVRGDFGRRLKEGIDFRQSRFKSETGRCPLLDPQGLCDIYKHLGKEKMCRTCRNYPRHMEDYGNIHEIMLSLSCPEAARLILTDPHAFTLTRGCKVYHLSPRQAKMTEPLPGMDRVLYVRDKLFKMLCDSKYPFPARLKRMMKAFSSNGHWVETLFEPLIFGEKKAREPLTMLFSLESVCDGWEDFLRQALRILNSENNTARARADFLEECRAREYLLVNLAAHYLYMYFAGAVYDGDMGTKVRLMAFHVWIVLNLSYAERLRGSSLENAFITAAWRYSRQVDHWDINLKALEMILK